MTLIGNSSATSPRAHAISVLLNLSALIDCREYVPLTAPRIALGLQHITMSDNAELSVLVRLQHLVLHDPIVNVPAHNPVAWTLEDKLGQQEQQRPQLFPAGTFQAAAQGGENTNDEIDIAMGVQVEPPRRRVRNLTSLRMKRKWEAHLTGVTCLKMKKKWEAHLIHSLDTPEVRVHGRKKKRRPAVQFLGFFDTADQAQQAYDNAILELATTQLEQTHLADNLTFAGQTQGGACER